MPLAYKFAFVVASYDDEMVASIMQLGDNNPARSLHDFDTYLSTEGTLEK